MFACAAPQHPEHADDIARVLAVPGSGSDHLVTHLTEEEITALLQAPDPGTWTGRRDHADAGRRHHGPARRELAGLPAPILTWATAPTWNVMARAGKTG